MKYFLAILAGLLVLGCTTTQNQNNRKASNSQNAIYDEEFDLLVAPEYDYESDVPYAEQIKTTTQTTTTTTYSRTEKPAKHPVSVK
ncbi:MAG: hypothetical protein IKP23_04020 [Elusimicrobiaceae bacterium]|nr:hypothetical protein [Elusimicrobiaceae bacterium]